MIDPYSFCPCGSGKKYKFCCLSRTRELRQHADRRPVIGENGKPAPGLRAPCLPIVDWIRGRNDPFTLADVSHALETGLIDRLPEAPERHLARMGEVAGSPDRYVTPRIVAHHLRFLIQLTPEEREHRVFILGHRLLPLIPKPESPLVATWVGPDGRAAGLQRIPMDAEVARRLHAAAGREAHRGCIDPGGVCRVVAYRLEDLGVFEDVEEAVVGCLSFDDRRFTLQGWKETHRQDRSRAERRLGDLFRRVPSQPVRGQWLAWIAAGWDEFSHRPHGELDRILAETIGARLDAERDPPSFVIEPKAAAEHGVPARGCDPERLIEAILAEQERWSAPLRRAARGSLTLPVRIRKIEWDPVERGWFVRWEDGGYGREASLSIFLGSSSEQIEDWNCDCFPVHGSCRHLVAAGERLLALLRDPTHPLTLRFRGECDPEVNGWDWRNFLEGVERAGAALRRPEAAAEDRPGRLVWRIAYPDPLSMPRPILQWENARTGAWTKGGRPGLQTLVAGLARWITPQDRQVVACLWRPVSSRSAWAGEAYESLEDPLPALEALAGHPRVFWDDAPDQEVQVERGAFRLEFLRTSRGNLRLTFAAGDLIHGVNAQGFYAHEGAALCASDRSRVIVARIPAPVASLCEEHLGEDLPILPASAATEFLEWQGRLDGILPVTLPGDLNIPEVEADGRIVLRLAPAAGPALSLEACVRPLPAPAPTHPPGAGPAKPVGTAGGGPVRAVRDLAAETERARGIARVLGLSIPNADGAWSWRREGEEALDAIARLQALSRDDLVVEWPQAGSRWSLVEATPATLRVRVEDGRDWFGLAGHVDLDGGRVDLAAIFDALRQGRRWVSFRDGAWARIGDVLRAGLEPLAHAAHREGGALAVGPTAAPLLAELAREAGTLQACAAWARLAERFDRAMAGDPEPPAAFGARLRPYQRDGFRWLARLAEWGVGGCLADDMGLGKTIQMLALLLHRAPAGPALVVAPVSVGTNWRHEAERFCPGLRPVLYRETDRDAGPAAYGPGDLVIVSYALLLRDVDRLAAVTWNTLVVDEAQFVKNAGTKTAQALRRLRADWRVALTGTPMENHLGELWGVFRAVCPGLFGSWEQYRERFVAPIERGKDESRRALLARVLRPFVLRRTKDEVLRDLPPRTEIRLSAELSLTERKRYDAARIEAIQTLAGAAADTDAQRRIQVLAALTKLRQLACHPRLLDPSYKGTSAKLSVFLETVDEVLEGGHRALVFSQFTRHLALVREALDERGIRYAYLDGATAPARRDQAVAEFQSGAFPLFLISLKAGGTGLNLTAADYVIHLDPWWNPAVEDQATDRAHRIGQEKPVFVYRIVAAGTIEEQILALHADKRNLVAGVLEGTGQAARMSTDELVALIRGGADPAAAVAAPASASRGK